jgi:hypothetical protein
LRMTLRRSEFVCTRANASVSSAQRHL